jgi:hypothetical protein
MSEVSFMLWDFFQWSTDQVEEPDAASVKSGQLKNQLNYISEMPYYLKHAKQRSLLLLTCKV